MIFENVIGHDEIKKQLINSLYSNKIAHAHIFCGEDGIGKSIISREFSIGIIGKEEDRPYADIIDLRIAEGKQSIGINEVLKIIDEINKKPYEGNRKVVIIHQANKMTTEAQNAFLKTIEEPPKGVYIMLLCEGIQDVLDTIKSRCQIHDLKRLNKSELTFFINRDFPEITKDTMSIVISFSDGNPGRAVSYLTDGEFFKTRETILDVIRLCTTRDKLGILKYEDFFTKNKVIWKDILICFIYYIRDIIMYKETGNETLIINFDKITDIRELSSEFSFNKLSGMVEIIDDLAENLERNVNMALAVDAMLLKMQEV